MREPQSWLPRAWRICALLLFAVVLLQSGSLWIAFSYIAHLTTQNRELAASHAGFEATAKAAVAQVEQCVRERERLTAHALEMARQCSRRSTLWELADAR